MSTSTTRRARQTKTLVSVMSAQDLNVDDCEGTLKWYSICEEHGTAIAHPTKALANFFAPVPCEWCGECAESQDNTTGDKQ
jgi:hypothetical protein